MQKKPPPKLQPRWKIIQDEFPSARRRNLEKQKNRGEELVQMAVVDSHGVMYAMRMQPTVRRKLLHSWALETQTIKVRTLHDFLHY